jgi:hypothetical protein
MAELLQLGVSIVCPHGGTASIPAPVNTRVTALGRPVLVETDVALIAGCTFTVGSAPSPCVRIAWSAPATRVKIAGQAALLSTSTARCLNAAGSVQGTATVTGPQTRVSGR